MELAEDGEKFGGTSKIGKIKKSKQKASVFIKIPNFTTVSFCLIKSTHVETFDSLDTLPLKILTVNSVLDF